MVRTTAMARRQCRIRSGTFKAQLAVAALRGDKTVTELAEKFQADYCLESASP